MASLSTATGLHDLLAGALSHDARRVLLGEDMRALGGAGGAFAGLAAAHPDQVRDVPIADRAAVGMAVGLALAGRKPVVELTGTGRLAAVLEALAEAGSIAAAGEFTVPLVVRVPTGGQAGDRIDRPMAEALAGLPGLTVLCPSDAGTVLGAWQAALASRGPVVILEPRTLLTRRTAHATPVRIGEARLLREGGHVSLIAWGSSTPAALAAAEVLTGDGIQADVIDLQTLSPLDEATLGARVRATGRAIVVDAPEGGLDHRVLRAVLDGAFLYLEAPPATASADPADVVAEARAAVHY